LAENNIPRLFSNHLSRMFPTLFPDSKIAQKYSAAATKTTCMINGAIAPHFLRETVNIMKCSPFSLLTNGSNDTGLDRKKNPLTVKIFYVNTGRVESRFLDMCATKGTDPATAASILQKIDDMLSLHGISWTKCVGFGVDNTNVNLGSRISIMTRVKHSIRVYWTTLLVYLPLHHHKDDMSGKPLLRFPRRGEEGEDSAGWLMHGSPLFSLSTKL